METQSRAAGSRSASPGASTRIVTSLRAETVGGQWIKRGIGGRGVGVGVGRAVGVGITVGEDDGVGASPALQATRRRTHRKGKRLRGIRFMGVKRHTSYVIGEQAEQVAGHFRHDPGATSGVFLLFHLPLLMDQPDQVPPVEGEDDLHRDQVRFQHCLHPFQ